MGHFCGRTYVFDLLSWINIYLGYLQQPKIVDPTSLAGPTSPIFVYDCSNMGPTCRLLSGIVTMI